MQNSKRKTDNRELAIKNGEPFSVPMEARFPSETGCRRRD